DFLALVAHELRNPLAAIIGYAQLMRRRLSNTKRGDQSLDVIVAQASQLNRLVDDMLVNSDSASEQLDLEPRLMDLVALARTSVQGAGLLSPLHVLQLE